MSNRPDPSSLASSSAGGTSRRDVLRAGLVVGALATLTGCDAMTDGVAGLIDPGPDHIELPDGDTVDPAFLLLSRAAYGPRPGDVQIVREQGLEAWIDSQLRPDSISDVTCELRLGECENLDTHPSDLRGVERRFIERDLVRHALIRAVHTNRQLEEVMVGFWTDHLSIDTGKRGCMETKPLDDREVIRAHALGRFRDLIGASALSPAMLIYLDGRENRLGDDGRPANENYARELMELHTLGVHGGYTQHDVMEAARCLTGWTLRTKAWDYGAPEFHADLHDDDAKEVLGQRIPAGGGEKDLERLLDIVCSHPATARYVSGKLCRKLVADPPPASIVESATATFTRTDGDIAKTVRHILTSAEFAASAGAKVKRPFRFIVSSLRAVGARCRADNRERSALTRLGHAPFRYPTPDGYPEEPDPWMGTLLWRWNFALDVANGRLGRTKVDLGELVSRCGLDPRKSAVSELAPLFFGRRATADERVVIDDYAERAGDRRHHRQEALALLLCAPAFQVT